MLRGRNHSAVSSVQGICPITLQFPAAIAIAAGYHQAGDLQRAKQVCRQIFEVQPNYADVLHLVGVIAYQVGKSDVAVDYIGKAIAINGNNSNFHLNIGAAYQALGKL